MLAAGVRATRRLRPALASVLGIALTNDVEGCDPGPEPLRRLGIEPRALAAFVAEPAGGTG